MTKVVTPATYNGGHGYVVPISGGWPPFTHDARGNRLLRWQAVRATDTGEPRLRLCGPDSVVAQLEQVIGPCTRLRLTPDLASEWTHRLRLPRELDTEDRVMLDLLKDVLTIDCGREVTAMLALDFYKVPVDGMDPYDWPNSAPGALINRGKYASSAEAGRALCDAMASVAQRHPLYRAATSVLTVPGSDTRKRSFGERIAAGVARRLDVPVVETTTEHEVRPQSKEGESFDLSKEFTAGRSLTDEIVLVVDDVCRSGRTMRAMALAAKRAGAIRVLGLAGARTMRR